MGRRDEWLERFGKKPADGPEPEPEPPASSRLVEWRGKFNKAARAESQELPETFIHSNIEAYRRRRLETAHTSIQVIPVLPPTPSKPDYDLKLLFGKHQGETVSQLITYRDGVSYLKWFKDQAPEVIAVLIEAWLRIAAPKR